MSQHLYVNRCKWKVDPIEYKMTSNFQHIPWNDRNTYHSPRSCRCSTSSLTHQRFRSICLDLVPGHLQNSWHHSAILNHSTTPMPNLECHKSAINHFCVTPVGVRPLHRHMPVSHKVSCAGLTLVRIEPSVYYPDICIIRHLRPVLQSDIYRRSFT